MEITRSRRRPMAILIGISVAVILFGSWFLIRSYVMAAYSLPTTSMEKTIHLGGKVVVNKVNYLPIKRGDIIVFHFPAGDTVIDLPEYQSAYPYYDLIRQLGKGNADSGRRIVLASPEQYPLSIRPVERREHYLKRCIAVPGDKVEMRDEQVYIDGQQQAWPPTVETYFVVYTSGRPFDEGYMRTEYGVDIKNPDEVRSLDSANAYYMLLTWQAREKMLKDGFARRIVAELDASTEGVFPFDAFHQWTRDNYGPIWVPKKGASIRLTTPNYAIYERVIRTYEGNRLEMQGGKIFINGLEASDYTFKMNYYWVIGDNLHGSQDSRYWGFVPEDHLIGKVKAIL
ncbi:MAG: hypothetical protein JST42_05765 [Bacteroidetes bacterium]|nr:hypothetical protein [Bacteroidota bacterium]